jgi:hypothetical protein
MITTGDINQIQSSITHHHLHGHNHEQNKWQRREEKNTDLKIIAKKNMGSSFACSSVDQTSYSEFLSQFFLFCHL